MSLDWKNIADGDIASSVRTKLNNLGQYASDLISIIENTTIPTSTWVSDTTHSPLAFKATVNVTGVSATDLVTVLFSQTDQSTYNYAGGEVGDDTITIYAITKPSSDLTIPQILVFKGVS